MAPPEAIKTDRPIIIFDGVCNFCNSAINFVVKRDKESRFMFAPSQGETGKALLDRHNLGQEAIETVVLIDGETALIKGDAALAILKELRTVWKVLLIGKVIPRPIRDWLYTYLAKNRYRLFGKLDTCIRPSPDLRDRFLE